MSPRMLWSIFSFYFQKENRQYDPRGNFKIIISFEIINFMLLYVTSVHILLLQPSTMLTWYPHTKDDNIWKPNNIAHDCLHLHRWNIFRFPPEGVTWPILEVEVTIDIHDENIPWEKRSQTCELFGTTYNRHSHKCSSVLERFQSWGPKPDVSHIFSFLTSSMEVNLYLSERENSKS